MASNPHKSFYIACFQGQLTDATNELEKGANINFTCSNGWTALHGSAYSGHLEVVKFLVAKGLDIEQKNLLGQTPLHLAASSGHSDIVSWFYSVCGANEKLKTVSGNTAIDIGRLGAHALVVEVFGESLEVPSN